jgi:hypothetical protein
VVLASLAPLRAQDADGVYAALFHSLRQQERPAEPEHRIAPAPPPSAFHRFPRRPRQTVREKKRDFKKIESAKPVPKPAQIPANPHLALMTDPTLLAGDIVIFPDGPRVFRGQPGDRHAMSDFVPFAKAKGLTKADRKYLAALRTGVNDTWVVGSDATKVAQKARDVETTGSISKKRTRR